MIILEKRPYCDNCEMWESRDWSSIKDMTTHIKCKYYERCVSMELYIRKELAEGVMEDDDIK